MIGSLIYYKDTHSFYDKYYTEIEDIRWELEAEGIEINITDQKLRECKINCVNSPVSF